MKKIVVLVTFISLLAGMITVAEIQRVNDLFPIDGYDNRVLTQPAPSSNPCPADTCTYGVATTYDATNHACAGQRCWVTKTGAWWTTKAPKSLRWVSVTKPACKKHPEWHCRYKKYRTWSDLVRPYFANMKVYAAAGPELRKLISKAYGGFPSLWHKVPFVRVRFTQVLPSGAKISNIIYIVDTCSCERLADFSPAAWHLFEQPHLKTGGWDHHLYAKVILP